MGTSIGIWTNGTDSVFAHNEEEARNVLMLDCGYDIEDADGDGWRELLPQMDLTVEIEDHGPQSAQSRTVAEWVAGHVSINGDVPGFFASTEY
jgi:hypothetical protein